ncbi:MAG TPA: BMC domain-containing protein [Anaerolineae bacterium]|nr:BMC domain-containing protein [Anaerolineae bacterium]HOQ97951.1 BMC domain-containing protein [Anaerolineae bacterium]
MDLRTFVLIDSMQPQYAALTGILLQGDTPVEGMAEVFMELAPASDVYEALDAALKTSDVRPGLLRVEREYGTLEIHGFYQEGVIVAGRQSLAKFGLTEADRWKPEVVSVKTVTGVDAWQAQLVNQASRGGLLLRGQTLCVIEVAPAGYVMLAANEAEKAAEITLVHYQPSGKFGRLYIAGTESAVRVARDAAVTAINSLPGLKAAGRGGA